MSYGRVWDDPALYCEEARRCCRRMEADLQDATFAVPLVNNMLGVVKALRVAMVRRQLGPKTVAWIAVCVGLAVHDMLTGEA